MKTMNNMTLIDRNGEGRRDFLKKAFMMGALLLTSTGSLLAQDDDKDLYPDDKTKKNNKNNNKKGAGNTPGRPGQNAPRPGVAPAPRPGERRYNQPRPRFQTPVEIQIYQGNEKENKFHRIEAKVVKVLKKYFKEEYRTGNFHISLIHNPRMTSHTGHYVGQNASIVIRRRGLLGLGTQTTLGRYEIESRYFEEYLLNAIERFARR